jgi:hypothetical protein
MPLFREKALHHMDTSRTLETINGDKPHPDQTFKAEITVV